MAQNQSDAVSRVVAQLLLALAQVPVRVLQGPAHGLERRHDASSSSSFPWVVAAAARAAAGGRKHVVVTEKAGESREMSGHEAMGQVEDEHRTQRDRRALAGQDDDGLLASARWTSSKVASSVRTPSCCCSPRAGGRGKVVAHRYPIAVGAAADDHRISAVGGLAHLDEAHCRQAQDPSICSSSCRRSRLHRPSPRLWP